MTVDGHIGMAFAGLFPDARALAKRARGECDEYRQTYGSPIPVRVLNERVGLLVQAYTLYGHLRPFGVSSLIAGVDERGPQLYMVQPSGLALGYRAIALGKGQLPAKTELERLKPMTCREALAEVARILFSVHDDVKDKPFELELSWVCTESKNKHQLVPQELIKAAEAAAKAKLAEQDMDD